jgi:urate oxidase
MSSNIVLGQNQYGKALVRFVKFTRDTRLHEIEDLNVTSLLSGDFEAANM